MAEPTVSWKPREENTLIGTEIPRIDGIEKASGRAKYMADTNTPGTLFGKLLVCQHAHAKVKRLNVEPARQVKGVHAVHIFRDVDSVVRWDGTLIAAVAAERPEIAEDAVRAIQVEYEVLPHFVDEVDLEAAKKLDAEHCDEKGKIKPEAEKQGHVQRVKARKPKEEGDVDGAIKNAPVVSKGYYGLPTITHMCMEPHGSHCEWMSDDKLKVHLSTQNVSGTAGQIAGPLGMDAANVEIICEYIGGGFGSKFSADEWAVACARLAKEAGRPVRLTLDRPTEQKTAGNRPSGFAEVTLAADKDGKILAWDSHHWGTNGMGGGTVRSSLLPYVYQFKPFRRRESGIVTNNGPARAWRGPTHPQACQITDTAIDDLAAKLGMDSYDVFLKNLDKAERNPDTYAAEMAIGAKLIDWKAKWHPHGKGAGRGAVKRGLGMAVHSWPGTAGKGNCNLRIHPDGTVETFLGTQDLGTGTRTVIAITLAETFGIPMSAVKVNIGRNTYPPCGPSGGSTTVGGVSGPNRRAGLEALAKIFDLVATKYGVDAGSLKAKDGKIVSGDKVVCTWKQATGLLGVMPLEIAGTGPKGDGLTDQHAEGVQMADVSVDTETGQVRINKYVCVQDCGLIIDLLTAKSQVLGAMTMCVAYALYEERIVDNETGRFINADLENYKLPRIGDIGELVAEMYQPDSQYARGVIGLGEPPVISGGAAISNAVANAIGVRVPVLPLTPQRVLEALKGGRA